MIKTLRHPTTFAIAPLALAFGLGVALPAMTAAPAYAQSDAAKAKPARVRGDVTKLEGSMLTVDSRDRGTITIDLSSDVIVKAVEKAAITDIKEGDFVGVASVPESGSDNAVEVLIFPAALKGFGEGSYPWDLTPDSTMTNATVANAVTDVADKKMTLKYPEGEKTITLPNDIPVVTLADATVDALTPGSRVFVPGNESDGKISAKFVIVGKDGVVPPM